MKYLRLTSDHDMAFGNGMGDYLEDSDGNPEAIAQAIKTHLLLFLGEWWRNSLSGMPMWQRIIGQRPQNKSIVDRIIIDRIKDTKLSDGRYAVISVSNVDSTFDPETREYQFQCTVDTVFGTLYLTNGGV